VPISVNSDENGDSPSEFEDIDLAEEELIDAYVRNELPPEERKVFEKGLRTTPFLVNRLHFARLLAAAADRSAEAEVSTSRELEDFLPPRKSWWPFGLTWGPAVNLAFASCALVLVIGGGGLLSAWITLRHESQQLAEQQKLFEQQKLELQKSASEQQLTVEQLKAQLREMQQKREADQQMIADLRQAQNQKPTAPSPTIATLFLHPALRDSEREKELKLSAGTSRIRLQLAVASIDYRSFLVEVKNSQDKVIFEPKVRSPRSGKVVTVTILSKFLPAGTYSLQLIGISPEGTSEPVGNYNFRIAPR
jgi:hypothetical protein